MELIAFLEASRGGEGRRSRLLLPPDAALELGS
jgi:hypothetical protein